MSAESIDEARLAPLEELFALMPQIQPAKERADLGEALRKVTSAAEQFDAIPEKLGNLATLLDVIADHSERLREDIGDELHYVIQMAKLLAGSPSKEDLVKLHQDFLSTLGYRIQTIERPIEARWRDFIERTLGGRRALGEVLSTIPNLQELGRDLMRFAVRVESLKLAKGPPRERAAERDELVAEVSALANRLLTAGVAPPIAQFLVAVAANPVQLSDLTEEVFDWIRTHAALTRFVVSTRKA